MWEAYKYTYYWLYTWQKKLWGESDLPEFTAIFGMSLSFGFMILSLFVITNILFETELFPNGIPKKEALFIMVINLSIHYFLFIHRGRYKRIEEEYKGERKEERRRKGRWVLLYAFGSPAFFILLSFFAIWVKHE